MNKIWTIFLIAALALLAGCAAKQESTEVTPAESSASGAASSPATQASAPAEEKAKCDGCGTEVEKGMLAMIDGKNICPACASKTAEAEGSETAAEMGKCVQCQKEMKLADLRDHDGAKFCDACIATHNH